MGDQKPFSKARCHPTCRLTQNQDLTSQRRILPAMTLSLPIKVFAVAACLLMVGCTASNDCDTFRDAVRSVQRRSLLRSQRRRLPAFKLTQEMLDALSEKANRIITFGDVFSVGNDCQQCGENPGLPSRTYFEDSSGQITKISFCGLWCQKAYKREFSGAVVYT